MSDPTGPVEGTPAPSAAPETSSPEPWAPVVDRVGELASSVGDLTGRFDQLAQQLQPAPEPEADPWAALFGDQAEEPAYEPQQPALDPAMLRAAYQADLQAAQAPLQQQIQQLMAAQAKNQLLEQIPALKDPAVAQAHVDSMVQQMTAAGVPVQNIEWALSNPHTIATYFKAAEAEKLAQGQAPASEQVPNVESAGGAVPGGNGEPVNPVHQAYAARQQAPPKGFL